MRARKHFKLGGVTYTSVRESTSEHDDFFEVQRGKAGLRTLEMNPGEDAAAFTRRIFDQIADSGSTNTLLACLIVPRGRRWSPAVAAETARNLGELTDPKEKALRRQLLAELLIRFFVSGLTCVVSSPRSFGIDQPIAGSSPTPDPTIDGGDGVTSFAPSPATTSSAPNAPPGGHSASY